MKLSLFSLSAVVALTVLLHPSPSFALPALSISINNVVSFDNHRVIRIQVNSEAELQTLTANENSLALDYFTHHKVVGGHIDVRISPQSFEKFQHLNLKYSTLIENLQSVIDKEQKEDEQYQQFWVAKINEAKLNEGKNKNLLNVGINVLEGGLTVPEGVEAFTAADAWFQGYHTYADHQIWLATQISNKPGMASAFSAGLSYQGRSQAGIKIGSGPNHIVFHGTQHSREWISTMVVE